MIGTINQLIPQMVNLDKEKTFELIEKKEKRSRNANSYCWELLGKIAELNNIPVNAVYRSYIKDLSIFKQIKINKEATDTFITSWSMHGIGWIAEKVDEDGDFDLINAYYGSSSYNSKQMSRFVDNIVQDCKSIGIQTLEDLELERLIERFGK